MRLTVDDKKRIVADFSEHLRSAQALILAEYRGVSAESMTLLRRMAREKGLYLVVLRNTLAFRSVRESRFANLTDSLSGPLIYGVTDDFLEASKLFYQFAEDNECFVLRSASLGGKVLDESDIIAYAKLPSRNELLSELMGTMQAPIATFVRTLNEVPARFVRTLAAYHDSIS